MPEVVDFQKVRQEIHRRAQKETWDRDLERLRFLIQGHKHEGLYLNMIEEYGPSMAHMLEERFRADSIKN